MAAGKNDAEDNSDDDRDEKAFPFVWSVEHVEAALNHVRMQHGHYQFHHSLLRFH